MQLERVPRPHTGEIPPTVDLLARRFRAAREDASDRGLGDHREAANGRAYRWLVFGMFAAYILAAIAIFLARGQSFRPDNWAILLLIGAVLLGRTGAFLRDWIPFVLLVFGYEFLRGIAGEFVTGGGTVGNRAREELPNVRVENLVAFDRALFLGHEPVSTLQAWIYTRDDPRWWDYFAVAIYAMHFALPCIFAFLLWVKKKEWFWQFTLALCLMTYSAFAFFLLYPAAPPWLANSWGVVSGIGWPAGQVTSSIGYDPIRTLDTVSIWQNASPHPVAAMPSLHAAFPWLVLLFAVRCFGWRGLIALPYNVGLWFSVVYLANHWVVDVLAGIAWATLAFVLVDWTWWWIARRKGFSAPASLQWLSNQIGRAFAPVDAVLTAPRRGLAWIWRRITAVG